jgi:CheY-like chemotaxis protein
MTRIVAYVDDSKDDLFLFQSACKLAHVHFQTVTIEGGSEAILYLNHSGRYADRELYPEPDMVLLDLKMPGVDGFTVLRHLRSDPARIDCPVGLFTSSCWPGDIEEAGDLGANWYFLKPPDMNRLIEFVRALDESLAHSNGWEDMREALSRFSH